MDPAIDQCETIFENQAVSNEFYLYIYLILGHAVALLAAYLLNYHVLCNSGQNIHDMAITGIIRAPIQFFDENPSGRILNRFSKDMSQMDELLPVAFEDALTLFSQTLGKLEITFKIINITFRRFDNQCLGKLVFGRNCSSDFCFVFHDSTVLHKNCARCETT